MNTECVVPDWVHDVFVGYGDPAAANYRQVQNYIETMDWNDTFLDMAHLTACFPDHVIKVCLGHFVYLSVELFLVACVVASSLLSISDFSYSRSYSHVWFAEHL